MCEKTYSKRLAYSYLEDIAQEFHAQYGKRVNTVTRPYTFIEFDNYIQKAKKQFSDSRSRRNLNVINNQLQDVQRIMVQNIDDVLQRGTVLSGKFKVCDVMNLCVQVYYCLFDIIHDWKPKEFGYHFNIITLVYLAATIHITVILNSIVKMSLENCFCFFSELDSKTQNLSMLTEKYKKDATYLNTKSMYVKAAVGGIVFLVFILYFWVL